MTHTSETVEALVEQLSKLPTIGRKTANRLAAYILKMSREEVVEIAKAMVAAKDRVVTCQICYNVADYTPCPICASHRRDRSIVCVVEDPSDVFALERTGDFRGLYHVLGGVISPLDGIGPNDLRVRELVGRISGKAELTSAPEASGEVAETPEEYDDDKPQPPEAVPVQEVILALNPNVEGDTTAVYIGQLLDPFEVKVTRIARGLPIGGDLEFADEATLSRALEGRGTL